MKKKLDLKDRGRHLLVIMVIVCIGLMLGALTAPQMVAPVRSAAGYVVTPFQNGINSVGSWLAKELSGFRDVKKLNEENETLKKEIDELSQKNNELVQNQSELARLEELYQIDKKYSSYPKLAAEVISKEPGNWYNRFVVNRGTKDGIKVDMNVLGQGGLVGIVTNVGENWAEVRAIIDDESNISAMAANTSEPCVVTGNLLLMDSGKIDFGGLKDSDNQVTEGTSIVTSNISDKYLTGLLSVYVSEISLDSNNLTKSGTLIPAANFRNLREVLIITELKATKEDES